jgi:hypothetical protein
MAQQIFPQIDPNAFRWGEAFRAGRERGEAQRYQTDLATALAGGDYQGAITQAGGRGDLDSVLALQGAQREQQQFSREDQQYIGQVMNRAATELLKTPDMATRRRRADGLHARMVEQGYQLPQIQDDQLTDEYLQSVVAETGMMGGGAPEPEPMTAYQAASIQGDRDRLALETRKFEAEQATPEQPGDSYAEPFRHPDLGYGQFDAEGQWHPIEVENNTDTGSMGDPAARLYTAGKSIEMADQAIDTSNWMNTGLMANIRGGRTLLETQLEMLKANNAFLGLAELASQGVKLTPLSNADLVVAGNMVANLDSRQATDTLDANLTQVRDRYLNIYQQVLRGVREQYPDGNVPPNVAAVVQMFEQGIGGLNGGGRTQPANDAGQGALTADEEAELQQLRQQLGIRQ